MLMSLLLACDLNAKIAQLRRDSEQWVASLGTAKYSYSEVRNGKKKLFTDVERVYTLALVDPRTCDEKIVVVRKQGDRLVTPPDVRLEVVTRSSGIRWNIWGTEYEVIEPEGFVVLGVRWPRQQEPGGGSIPLFYVPVSDALLPLVGDGYAYLIYLALDSHYRVRELAIPSRAFPGQLLADVTALQPIFCTRLVVPEQMDLDEFHHDPVESVLRIMASIGANGTHFARYTGSPKKALGPQQFTPGTYALMVRAYPAAKLIPNFFAGATDPFNAILAARVLQDSDLAEIRSRLGPFFDQLVADPDLLEEALGAAYNGGASRVALIVRTYFERGRRGDWITTRSRSGVQLMPETKGYIEKLRFVRSSWPVE